MSETYKARIRQCEKALQKNLRVHIPEAKKTIARAIENLKKANEVKFSAKTASSKKYAETQFKNAERRLENANKYYDRLLVTVGKREKTLADLKARLQKSKSK